MIKTEVEVTAAVLRELDRAPDERFKQIMSAAVRHLHDFAREVKLSEAEFQQACAVIAKLGQASNSSHNEVVLAAGSLGLSALVCLLNNQHSKTANLLGPFWREAAPSMAHGESLVRSPTPGEPLFVFAQVLNQQGVPVPAAQVDVWHSSSEGFYENQDPAQADMNLRGCFETDAHGKFWFETIKPQGYPIPVNGPVGDLLRKQGRHNMRPAHIHFMIRKIGYKTQFSQVYASDDPHLETDVQFAVTERLIGYLVKHAAGGSPNPKIQGPWYQLDYVFEVQAGESLTPRAPITGKAQGPRPTLTVLRTQANSNQ